MEAGKLFQSEIVFGEKGALICRGSSKWLHEVMCDIS